MQLLAWSVRCKWNPDGGEIVMARTAGMAKSYFHEGISDLGIKFTDLRVRKCEVAEPRGFRKCASYRGFPWVKVGQRVRVGGEWGTIVGHNSSANWNVLFDDSEQVLNCHPRSEIAYYSDEETLIEEYDIRGKRISQPAAGGSNG